MPPPRPKASVDQRILAAVKRRGAGAVFVPTDFLALGSRRAVDVALHRLVKRGAVRRIARGIYDLPRTHRALGALARAYMAKGAIADAVGVWRRMIEACGPMVNREGLEGLIKDAEAKGADRREVTTDPGR